MNNANNTMSYYTAKQGGLPVFISEMLNISDSVLAFDHMMEKIEIAKYLKVSTYTGRRRGYNQVNMLKMILFGFMDREDMSMREIEDKCYMNIRHMYLMDYETPCYRTFGNFINDCPSESVEDIFKAVNEYIIKNDNVDLNHLYIDGSKF